MSGRWRGIPVTTDLAFLNLAGFVTKFVREFQHRSPLANPATKKISQSPGPRSNRQLPPRNRCPLAGRLCDHQRSDIFIYAQKNAWLSAENDHAAEYSSSQPVFNRSFPNADGHSLAAHS